MANDDSSRRLTDNAARQAHAFEQDTGRGHSLGQFFGSFYNGLRSVNVPAKQAAVVTGAYCREFTAQAMGQNPPPPTVT